MFRSRTCSSRRRSRSERPIASPKTGDAFSVDPIRAGGAAVAAAATCVNSLAQIHFADKLRDLNDVATEAQREIAVADFNKRFNDHVAALETASIAVSEAFEQVRRQLGIIED